MDSEINYPEQPAEVVSEPIHASVENAKCPKCNNGNLVHQIALGTVFKEGVKVSPHACTVCRETTYLAEDVTYPRITASVHGTYLYINREY